MATWDEIKDCLYATGRDVSKKAKDMSEIARLKMDIRAKEDFVEKQYAALGQKYYKAHKNDEAPAEETQFSIIEEALEEIERMKQMMLKLQGASECPKCGAKMPDGAMFCSNCGTRMNDLYEEE